MYYIYMLRCMDNSVYTGITTDINRRMNEHFSKSKKCAKYTCSHIASRLECVFETESRKSACKLEYYIKTLNKESKENIIRTGSLSAISDKIDCNEYNNVKKLD